MASQLPIKDILKLRYDPVNSLFTNNIDMFKRLTVCGFVVSCVEKRNHFILELEDGTGILNAILWFDKIDIAIKQFESYEFIGDLDYYSHLQFVIVFAKVIATENVFNRTRDMILS